MGPIFVSYIVSSRNVGDQDVVNSRVIEGCYPVMDVIDNDLKVRRKCVSKLMMVSDLSD
jgi:hypothetical protein